MWVIWRKLENFEMLAPSAWFNVEEEAREYAEYLATVGVEAVVVYDEGFSIAGKETVIPSLEGGKNAENKF